MDPARRRATYADLLEVPEHLVAEIVNGDLYANPRPASTQAFSAWAVGQDVGPYSRGPGGPGAAGGWWILFEPELHLGSDVLVPDLAGWRRERGREPGQAATIAVLEGPSTVTARRTPP